MIAENRAFFILVFIIGNIFPYFLVVKPYPQKKLNSSLDPKSGTGFIMCIKEHKMMADSDQIKEIELEVQGMT